MVVVRHWRAGCSYKLHARFGEGWLEKGHVCATSLASYSTARPVLRGLGGGNTSQLLSIEQDHRGIKQRDDPMRGFGSFEAATRFCTAHDELRDHLRYRHHLNETVSLADQRHLFQERWGEVCAVLQAA